MQYTLLGPTGLRVSRLCLGAMTFGTEWGWGMEAAECRNVFDAYADAGGNFIDTADIYTQGASEKILGELLQGRRDRFVVASKYTISTDHSDANAGGNHRKNLRVSLEASLRRLATDYIDLYWVHLWDGLTPIEETLRALEDAVRQGKVLHIGFSDFPAWLVARADALAEVLRWTRPAAIQVEYNLIQRDAERELLPMAEALGLAVLDWSPLGGGVLSGKYSGEQGALAEGRVASGAVAHFDQYRSQNAHDLAAKVVALSTSLGCKPAQLSLAWLLARSSVHIPIMGARTLEHLHDNLGASNLVIPPALMAQLDALQQVQLGFPHDFLKKGSAQWFGTWPQKLARADHHTTVAPEASSEVLP